MPTLSLEQDISSFTIRDINFTECESSFLEINQVNLVNATDMTFYNLDIFACDLLDNNLSSKDSLVVLGEINYKNFIIKMTNIDYLNNQLGLG